MQARRRIRLALLVVLFALLFLLGHTTGLLEQLDKERLRALLVESGPWGIVLFFVAFAAGQFMHVPGMIFVASAIFAYGRWHGFLIAWAGAVIAVTTSFIFVGAIGGAMLKEVQHPWMRRALVELERRPLLTVAALRAILWLNPGVTYALALTGIRMPKYVIGSSIGLIVPIAGSAVLFDMLFN